MERVTSWKELTLREKIGQTVVCLSEKDKHIAMCGSVEEFLKKYPIGGMFNNGGLVKGLLTGETLDFKNLLEEYNQYLRVPLIGTADRGAFAASMDLQLIPQMGLGAADDAELAYKAGEYMAMDCRLSGVHWVFWPVCDLNISSLSPIVNTRAVSDDPALNAKIVAAEVQALKDNGVAATLKHYPGSPYNETVDYHLAPVDNETPMELWWDTYGKMYKELINQGAPSIMTSHINLVDYQKEKIDGKYPPATMSDELVNGLLRGELGYKGVTVTDALVMGGFCGTGSLENTVRSFLGGNDVMLWPAYEYIDLMEQKILSGEIDEAVLDAAVERIWNLKQEYGVLEPLPMPEGSKRYFEDRVRQAAEACLTLVSDPNGVLPMNPKKVCIVGVTPDDGQYKDLCLLKTEFEKYGCQVTMQRNIWTEDAEQAARENDLLLFALCRTPHHPIGPMDFWGEEATSIWSSNCCDKTKTVVASFGSPYFYKYYINSGATYINAYSSAPHVMEAFVKAVLGKIPFAGKTPVKLN